MPGYIIKTINGVKQRVAVTGETGSGNPLGTIIAVYSNHVPDGYLPCNGTTFDQTQYPALYTLLGTNVLPDYRECALVGAGQNSSDTIADHDVYTLGEFKDDQIQKHKHGFASSNTLYASGSSVAAYNYLTENEQTADTGAVGRYGTVTRGKRKGVNFCIKATVGITENQADYVGDIIKDYVNDGESYSTDEVKTNKTWIDGKPIYRKVLLTPSGGVSIPTTWAQISGWSSKPANFEMLTFFNFPVTYGGRLDFDPTNFDVVSIGGTVSIQGNMPLVVEYTKTTD